MKVFSCFVILVSLLCLASTCCLKSKYWDIKTSKMDEMLEKMEYMMEKKLEMKCKLDAYKNMKQAMSFAGKLPCNCEYVFGHPIEQCKPKSCNAAPCVMHPPQFGGFYF
ncbi:uncharacterized protein LOC123680995 [Harmonia axyridis]|uniref:uncharacterized protein LOC123680995 n=1 Tax=Harmonia axyridis TaxID=115357 RepID=UPI001E2765F9|nr:uncharacterized protein LOC123680995 [Harmonia axyridis]